MRIKGCILCPGALLSQSKEEVERHLTALKNLGIDEVACLTVDMWKSFPQAIL